MAPHTETTLDNLSNPHHHPYPGQERRSGRRVQRSAWRPVLASALALWLGACGGQTPGPDVPPPVDPPRTCGSCLSYEQCMPSGSCGINPNSTWFFAVDSARIASTKTTDDAWDAFGGAPDPYVVLDTRRTTTQQDTFTPLWQEGATYTATNLLNQGVTVQVIDDDISAPDPIGGPTVVRPSEADLRRGTLTVANLGQATSITFSLTPR